MKIFDRKLYIEGLKQLRLSGFILFAIVFFLSLLLPIGYMLTMGERYDNLGNLRVPSIDILQVSPLLLVFMFIGPLVLILNIFNFNNRRNQVDFYNSTPNKRYTVFISLFLSALTWLTVIIVTTVLSCSVLYILSGAPFDYNFIPMSIFYNMAGTFLVASCVALGMSVTGTILTNMIVSGLILFFPRFIMFIFTYSLSSSLSLNYSSLVPQSAFGLIGDTSFNIPVNMLIQFYRGNSFLFFIGAIIYSFIFFILYSALALFIFNRRKSESAEKSAPNKWLQHIYRCAIALPISLIIPIIAFMNSNENHTIIHIVFIVLTLIVYFTYELITTKKLKNLLKAIPVLGFIILINILFGFTLTFAKDRLLAFVPAENEIEWVKIDLNRNRDYGNESTYAMKNLSNIKIESAEINKIIAERLKKTASDIKNNIKVEDNMQSYNPNSTLTFEIKSNGINPQQRCLYFENKNDLMKYLFEAKAVKDTLMALPPEKNINNVSSYEIGDKDLLKVWEMYKDEYSKLDFEKLKEVNIVLSNLFSSNKQYLEPFGYIDVFGTLNFSNFHDQYQITNYTPKALAMYIELVNKNNIAFKSENFSQMNIQGQSGGDSSRPEDINKVLNLYKEKTVIDKSLRKISFSKKNTYITLFINIDDELFKSIFRNQYKKYKD